MIQMPPALPGTTAATWTQAEESKVIQTKHIIYIYIYICREREMFVCMYMYVRI